MIKQLFVIIIISCLFSACNKNDLAFRYDDKRLYELLVIAKNAIDEQFDNDHQKKYTDIKYGKKELGVFIRLIKRNNERGCIGFIKGIEDINKAVKIAVVNAAFFDRRFAPLTKAELKDLEVEITIIDKLENMTNYQDFKIGKHSLYINDHSFHGFLQAQIAIEEDYDKKEFLSALCIKAGLIENDYLKKEKYLYRAETVSLRERYDILVEQK